ncbi:hypothetical protein BJX61DRAFT_506010 [Aspergillus egyptiacus]|nr:hypothetical protein BJX61DRAFT_506010 [Aspergillus egyptiacus]
MKTRNTIAFWHPQLAHKPRLLPLRKDPTRVMRPVEGRRSRQIRPGKFLRIIIRVRRPRYHDCNWPRHMSPKTPTGNFIAWRITVSSAVIAIDIVVPLVSGRFMRVELSCFVGAEVGNFLLQLAHLAAPVSIGLEGEWLHVAGVV